MMTPMQRCNEYIHNAYSYNVILSAEICTFSSVVRVICRVVRREIITENTPDLHPLSDSWRDNTMTSSSQFRDLRALGLDIRASRIQLEEARYRRLYELYKEKM